MAVDGEQQVFGWLLEHYDQLTPYVSGVTGGAMSHFCGNEFWRGQYSMYGQTVRFPNDSFSFLASAATGSKGFSGTARCSSIELTIDHQNTTYLETVVGYNSMSTLAKEQTSAADATIPAVLCSKGLTVTFDDDAVANLSYAKLRMFADLIPEVTNTTDGVVFHQPAPVNAICTWRVDSDDPADVPVEGTQGVLKFDVTDSTYWELTWMRIMGVQPFKVTRDGKKLVQFQVVAVLDFSDGTSLGTIKDPAEATRWP